VREGAGAGAGRGRRQRGVHDRQQHAALASPIVGGIDMYDGEATEEDKESHVTVRWGVVPRKRVWAWLCT
jgi:hypothetical protein